jgi:hypothetical protein
MPLPFTVEQFLGVFARYNEAIWPAQVVAYALGLAAIGLALWRQPHSDRAITSILALFWLFVGVVYQATFFRAINPIAVFFGALFVVQAIVLIWSGVLHDHLAFAPDRGPRSLAGGLLMLYALLIYPLLGLAFGHVYPAAPVFGVTPCPMTIFTFGLLMWTDARMPKWVLVVPLLWSVLGLSAATTLGVVEDLGLIVAALTAAGVLLTRPTEKHPLGHAGGLAA